MSDLYNHLLGANNIYNKLNDSSALDIIKKHQNIYYLGAQASDIFFYYESLYKNSEWVASLGKLCHSETNLTFFYAFEYINSIKENTEKCVLLAYIYGCITHHAVDTTTHPFIYYYSKFHTGEHKKLEIMLDILNFEYYNKPRVFPKEIFKLKDNEFALINAMYNHISEKVKNETIPDNLIKTSILTMEKLLKLTHKPSLVSFAKILEGKSKYKFSGAIYKISQKERMKDYLNLNHQFWCNPCDKYEFYNQSYPEVFEYGITKGVKNISAVAKLNNTLSKNDVAKIFKNEHYDTGTGKYTMKDIKYFTSIEDK